MNIVCFILKKICPSKLQIERNDDLITVDEVSGVVNLRLEWFELDDDFLQIASIAFQQKLHFLVFLFLAFWFLNFEYQQITSFFLLVDLKKP